jgi:hypothetical protein
LEKKIKGFFLIVFFFSPPIFPFWLLRHTQSLRTFEIAHFKDPREVFSRKVYYYFKKDKKEEEKETREV